MYTLWRNWSYTSCSQANIMRVDLGNRSLWTIGVIFILIVLICLLSTALLTSFDVILAQSFGWPSRDSLCPHVIACPMYSCQFGSRWSYFSGGHVDLSMCHCLFSLKDCRSFFCAHFLWGLILLVDFIKLTGLIAQCGTMVIAHRVFSNCSYY